MSEKNAITFIENKAAQAKLDYFMDMDIDVTKAIESWKKSLYSFEWINQDGNIKTLQELSEAEQVKRQVIEKKIQKGASLEKPVLGIGIMDNIEIGSGRATLLTLASKGLKIVPVHIPQSCESDFKNFIAKE